MVNLSTLKRAIMDDDNITLSEMEQIFEVTHEELIDSIRQLLSEDKNDELLQARLLERNDIIYGKININRDNKGVLTFGKYKYYIDSDNLKDALDNDIVIIEPINDTKNKAKVETVVERKDGLLIVNYTDDKFTPLSSPFNNEIILNEQDLGMIKPNDRIQVKIDKTVGNKTYCHLDTIIGHKDDLALDENTVAVRNGFHLYFPRVVQNELDEIPDHVRREEIFGRVDLRGKNSFTIDDDDTQDMDDALFVEILPNGNTLVGIPISHVSHYVKRDGAIFREAVERGTSLYLGKHSLPMFPRKLCNGIGSLNPNEDRLTRTVLVEFDKNNQIVDYKIVPSVIRSRKKMSYYEVEKIITKDQVRDDYIPFVKDLKKLYEISKALDKRREQRGALDFISQDVKIAFDSRMKPIGFHPLGNEESRRIIENFALLANELYDKDAKKNNVFNINRIELEPNPFKINEMIRWINNTGLSIDEIENIGNQRELLRVIEAVNQDERRDVFNGLLLRGMQKAKYSSLDLGHYGLALDYYAQFTSPIRRLGDFVNHSIYDDLDAGVKPKFSYLDLQALADQASFMERKSDGATREMNNIYMAGYMKEHIGEDFNGRIIDIGPYGALVKTENDIVGRVEIKDIQYGKYGYDKATGSLLDTKNGLDYKIGDKVKVTVKSASKDKGEIDFTLDEKLGEKKLVKKRN